MSSAFCKRRTTILPSEEKKSYAKEFKRSVTLPVGYLPAKPPMCIKIFVPMHEQIFRKTEALCKKLQTVSPPARISDNPKIYFFAAITPHFLLTGTAKNKPIFQSPQLFRGHRRQSTITKAFLFESMIAPLCFFNESPRGYFLLNRDIRKK